MSFGTFRSALPLQVWGGEGGFERGPERFRQACKTVGVPVRDQYAAVGHMLYEFIRLWDSSTSAEFEGWSWPAWREDPRTLAEAEAGEHWAPEWLALNRPRTGPERNQAVQKPGVVSPPSQLIRVHSLPPAARTAGFRKRERDSRAG